MVLQFFRGRSGTGKSRAIIEDVSDRLLANPLGDPIVIVVPEQMTYSVEKELISDPQINGSIRAQVMSLSRLTFYIMRELGGLAKPHLNKVGAEMQLRRILLEEQNNLIIYKNVVDKEGVVGHFHNLFTEYKRYSVSPSMLSSLEENIVDPLLKRKIRDTAHIYNKYTDWLDDRHVDVEDHYHFLVENIKNSCFLERSILYVDGFHGFTTLEMEVLKECICKCKETVIALTMDKPRSGEAEHLFRMPLTVYEDLNNWASENNIAQKEDRIFSNSVRFRNSASLQYAEANLFNLSAKPYPREPDLQITIASSRRIEVTKVAEQVLSLARKGHRFRDIVILLRNSSEYVHLLKTIFKDYRIPFFIDEKVSMDNHPIIECVRATLVAIDKNYNEESMFWVAKTDFLFKSFPDCQTERDLLALLENYVLERGIHGDQWRKPWCFSEGMPASDLENLRKQIINPLFAFASKINSAKTVSEYTDALESFLEKIEMEMKVKQAIKYYEEQQDILEATHYLQAWNELKNVLDQLRILRGDENVPFSIWKKMIENGFDCLHFSLPPPAMDQVIISNIDIARPHNISYVFILGLNDGVLPRRFHERGILTERDRTSLEQLGIKLAPPADIQLRDEDFLFYTILTVSKRKVMCSYTISDFEGNSLYESIYIKKIKQLFPKCKTIVATEDNTLLNTFEAVKDVFVHTEAILTPLMKELVRLKEDEEINPVWFDVYNKLLKTARSKQKLSFVTSSLFAQNYSEILPERIIEQMYGSTISGSVSRIELYNKCPFAHYVKYGLKLKERNLFALSPVASGNFFHESLKEVTNLLSEVSFSWNDLTPKQVSYLASEATKKTIPYLHHQVFAANARMHFLAEQHKKVLEKTIEIIQYEASKSQFTPWGFEVPFGTEDADIPSLDITLNNDKLLKLSGRIDRVDWLANKETRTGSYRVIDYKSSARKLDPVEIYNGISLQLFTYLYVLEDHMRHIATFPLTPSGVLYSPFKNPFLKDKETFFSAPERRAELLKKFRMTGILTDDINVLKNMDINLTEGYTSDTIPVGLKRDGQLSKVSTVISEEKIKTVMDYVKDIYRKSGSEILAGKTEISPYQLGDRNSCSLCSYKSICQFNPKNGTNKFRSLNDATWSDFTTDFSAGGAK